MNGLTLTIVNERSTYDQRKALGYRAWKGENSYIRLVSWAELVKFHAREEFRRYGKSYTVQELAETIGELDEYYDQYVREG